jgi:hypothetical protein
VSPLFLCCAVFWGFALHCLLFRIPCLVAVTETNLILRMSVGEGGGGGGKNAGAVTANGSCVLLRDGKLISHGRRALLSPSIDREYKGERVICIHRSE